MFFRSLRMAPLVCLPALVLFNLSGFAQEKLLPNSLFQDQPTSKPEQPKSDDVKSEKSPQEGSPPGTVPSESASVSKDKSDEPAVGKEVAKTSTPSEVAASNNKPEDQASKASSQDKSEDAKPDSGKTTTDKAEKSPKKQLRQLSLSGAYQDLVQPLSFNPTDLLIGGGAGKQKSFFRLCDYLEELGKDDLVTHVLVDLSDDSLSLNSAQLDELVRRMALLKSKGKKTIAWIENAGNSHLAIATQCDEIVMADFGTIDMPSAGLETTFYKDAMDLVGVKASIVRAGDFKGAVEPYLNPKMSDHLREHYVNMLHSINAAQVSRIAKGRGLTTASVRELQKKRRLLPSEALSAGLVTKLAPYGSMKKTVQEMVGDEIEWTTPKSKPKREMSFFELMGKIMGGGGQEASAKLKDNTIVVMHLQGAIVDGKEVASGSIVAGPTVKVIEELTKDEKVKGVVVRINSPGGSATASEAIRQALAELAKKKPVVFSMGDVAASGGYWVTCIGQPIYAEQGTITGSIGVFSMKISLGTLLKRVGVHIESVAIDASASMDAMDRSWSDEEISDYQRFIDETYHRFLSIASESRKLPVDKLKSLAGGRVWSGEQAKHAGLVDELGGVDDCLAVVAKKASLKTYNVIHRPEPSSGPGLLSMFEEPDDSQVKQIAGNLEQTLLSSLERYGFRLDGLRAILRDASRPNSAFPTVWALIPGELSIR